MDEYDLGGKKLFKTTYSWDAEGNRLSEMQYNHGQSGTSGNGNGNGKGTGGNAVISGALFNAVNVLDSLLEGGNSGTTSSQDVQNTPDTQSVRTTPEAPVVEIPSADAGRLSAESPIANGMALPDPTAGTAAGVVLNHQAEAAKELNAQLQNAAIEAEAPKPETPEAETDKPETGKEDASVEGNGDGNGQVPPGQTEEGDGSIVNPGGHMPPGLNRGEKGEKPNNPNKPEKPDNPGTEDSTDKQANKANKGTHKYTYDELNRMITSNIAGTTTTYTYDTLGNLVLEKAKNHVVDYQYNELNQLVQKKDGNESYTYTYDKRGNRTAEIGKKASRSYVYDETNRMVEGTNWKGDKSAYTYNGLGIRINNTHTTHAGKVYARDYVIDYTSFENDDLMVFAEGNGQLEYEQKHVYAGSERTEQFTDKGNWERILYVHEDVMGNTRYYTKANGQSFAELTYDAWGMPESPNKLLNNDHGNYVFATFTGHIYDTTLDIYFAEARFYDANNRSWLAMDPIKDGLNWYQYCYSNPIIYMDADGQIPIIVIGAVIGGVVGLGKNLYDQYNDNKDFSLWELIIKTGSAAATGALAMTGMPVLPLAFSSAGVDTFAEALVMKVRKEPTDLKELYITFDSSFVSTFFAAGLSAGLDEVAGKWFATRYRTADSIFRPTKDEALKEALRCLKVGGVGSYEWDIFITEILEQFATRTGRTVADTIISDNIYYLFDKFLGSESV